ncbi:MAG: transcription termination factor NusA [Ruminococcus sp.]|nr:transcription termination factor NusA [Oscillospiraceae bacterium]MDY4413588.1 transcription termination factor NusA [Ruminococcus sp.]
MDNSFFKELEILGNENSVDIETLVEKVKSAMLKAAKRAYPHSEDNIRIDIDIQNKIFNMYIVQQIIDDVPIDINEINIEDAKAIDPTAYVGGTMLHKIDIASLGRTAAISAKQSIKGDLRQINREQIMKRFGDKKHCCINVKVSQIDPSKGDITVDYEGTELYLFKKEQIPGETFKIDQNIKVYITDIANPEKKPIIKISRSHKDFVKRLFEIEVPEIYDGTVEIKAISREAGSRTKMAVWSKNSNVEPVGACIGPKSSRITAVVKELNGEKIDIIPYSENPAEFIARSLAPAKVLKTVITTPPAPVKTEETAEAENTADSEKKSGKESKQKENKTCTVIVPNDQLSLAIGNKGQNAKLAAKLTGYKIDIKPQFDIVTGEEASELKDDTQKFLDSAGNDDDMISEENIPENDEIIIDDSDDSGNAGV